MTVGTGRPISYLMLSRQATASHILSCSTSSILLFLFVPQTRLFVYPAMRELAQTPANTWSMADGVKTCSMAMAAAPMIPARSPRDDTVICRSVVLRVVDRW